MTDRVKGFTVTLKEDVRIDDVEAIMNAIQMIIGVAHVEPSIVTSDDYINRMQISSEVKQKLYEFLKTL